MPLDGPAITLIYYYLYYWHHVVHRNITSQCCHNMLGFVCKLSKGVSSLTCCCLSPRFLHQHILYQLPSAVKTFSKSSALLQSDGINICSVYVITHSTYKQPCIFHLSFLYYGCSSLVYSNPDFLSGLHHFGPRYDFFFFFFPPHTTDHVFKIFYVLLLWCSHSCLFVWHSETMGMLRRNTQI